MNIQHSYPIQVLLIEDDEEDYLIIRNLLSDFHASASTLHWVTNYEEALGAVRSGKFDVCLLDYRLGPRSGLELLEEIIRSGCQTPVIFLTGQGDYELDLVGMRTGAADYLTKDHLSATLLERTIRYTLKRGQKRDELLKAKRMIQALSECNDAVIRIKDEVELLREICRIVVDTGGYRMAWVGYAEQDGEHMVTPLAKYGYEAGYLDTVGITWRDGERGSGPTGTSICTQVPSIVRSVDEAEFEPWREEASKRGYASVIGLPVVMEGRALGALTIYASERDAFDAEEVELLVKLSGNLSYGIGALRLYEAHRKAEESLRASHLNLEKCVEVRTAELVKVNEDLTREVEERRRTEDALRISEKRLRRAEEVALFGNWELVMDRNELKASDGAKLIYGFKGSTWSLPQVQSIVLPEYRPVLDEALKRLIEEGEPYEVEFKIQRPTDGKVLDIHSMAEYFSEKGLVFGVIQDITERKKMDEALRKSEEKLRSILSAAPVGIGLVADRVILEVNDHLCSMTGYLREELLHRSSRALYPTEEDYQAVGSEKYRQISEKGTGTVETKWQRKDGAIIDVLLSSTPLHRADDLSAGVTFNALDITERKRAEEALREGESKYKALYRQFMTVLEAIPDSLSLIGTDRRVIWANTSALRGMASKDGFTPGEQCYTLWHGRTEPCETCPLFTSATEDELRVQFFSSQDGREWEIRLIPVKDDAGVVIDILRLARDITENRKLEAQLREAQKMEAIGTLAGGIAHDFNNILAPIIGYTQIVLEDSPDLGFARQDLEQVLKAANRAKELVRQILNFSHHGPKQELIPADVGMIVKEVLKLLQASLPSTIEIRKKTGKSVALVDATQIHQVIVNLCTNAAHAMDGTGILDVCLDEVCLSDQGPLANSSIPGLKPGSYVKLSVSDTGHGMDKGTLQRVFEPYFTTKEVGKGTGLGLAVVHRIVKQHGGEITARSEPGKGSVFEVYLPLVMVEAKSAVESFESLPKGSEHVLLVDDERMIVEMGARMLEKLGYRITAKTSPKEVLDLFRSKPDEFDLIITDYTMPQMTGSDLASKILEICPEMPIILCTGYSEKAMETTARELGIAGFAMKPLDRWQLAELVRNTLDGNKR